MENISFCWSTENESWPVVVDLLQTSLLPECHQLYPGNDIVFMQDSALSVCAKTLQQFLRRNTPAFITADEWASYSADLNALDYCIWDIQQDLVYKGRRLEVYRISKKQSKTNKRRSSLRQFENPLHDGKKTTNAVRKQNGGMIQHIFH